MFSVFFLLFPGFFSYFSGSALQASGAAERSGDEAAESAGGRERDSDKERVRNYNGTSLRNYNGTSLGDRGTCDSRGSGNN